MTWNSEGSGWAKPSWRDDWYWWAWTAEGELTMGYAATEADARAHAAQGVAATKLEPKGQG